MTDLKVGKISVDESVLMQSPRPYSAFSPETIDEAERGWAKVWNAIERSKGIINRSSKQRLATPWSSLGDHLTGATLEREMDQGDRQRGHTIRMAPCEVHACV